MASCTSRRLFDPIGLNLSRTVSGNPIQLGRSTFQVGSFHDEVGSSHDDKVCEIWRWSKGWVVGTFDFGHELDCMDGFTLKAETRSEEERVLKGVGFERGGRVEQVYFLMGTKMWSGESSTTRAAGLARGSNPDTLNNDHPILQSRRTLNIQLGIRLPGYTDMQRARGLQEERDEESEEGRAEERTGAISKARDFERYAKIGIATSWS